MGRIAATEDVEGIREEEDAGGEEVKKEGEDSTSVEPTDATPQPSESISAKATGKYIATLREVQDAFDSVNTLRYSQPTHLQGSSSCVYMSLKTDHISCNQANVKVLLLLHSMPDILSEAPFGKFGPHLLGQFYMQWT